MKHLYIRVSAVSPLSVRTDHAPGGAATTKYIPGSAFVGGLAAIYRLLHPEKHDEFEQLFLREEVLYSNLYPAVFKDEGLHEQNLPVYPVPKTAQSCKRHPGFLFPKNKDNDAHGVRDSLIDWAMFVLGSDKDYQQKETGPLAALRNHKDCRYRATKGSKPCCEAMDHFDGYYRCASEIPDQITASEKEKYTRLRTHTGIDRESGTVQDGILYNRQVFEEGMQFWGLVKFPDNTELITQFQDFLKEIGSEGLVHIGTGRSRGMAY